MAPRPREEMHGVFIIERLERHAGPSRKNEDTGDVKVFATSKKTAPAPERNKQNHIALRNDAVLLRADDILLRADDAQVAERRLVRQDLWFRHRADPRGR